MSQTVPTAVQIILAIIPIVGIVFGSFVCFMYLLWHHKRTSMLIQMGQYEKPQFDLLSFCLLTGLLLISIGLSLTIVFYIVRGIDYSILGGVLPLSVGIGLVAFYGIKHGDRT